MGERDPLVHLRMTLHSEIPNYFLVSTSVENRHALTQVVPLLPRRKLKLILTLLHPLVVHQWKLPPCLNFDAGHVLEVLEKGATETQMMAEKPLHERGFRSEALSCQFDRGIQATCGSR